VDLEMSVSLRHNLDKLGRVVGRGNLEAHPVQKVGVDSRSTANLEDVLARQPVGKQLPTRPSHDRIVFDGLVA
jgi:hypothetical protein